MKAGFVMQLIGLIRGMPTSLDGKYLVSYDPDREGIDPDGNFMLAHIEVTDDLDKAATFRTAADAMELWKKPSTRWPLRPDGEPNRPLTAFTVEVAQREKFRAGQENATRPPERG